MSITFRRANMKMTAKAIKTTPTITANTMKTMATAESAWEEMEVGMRQVKRKREENEHHY